MSQSQWPWSTGAGKLGLAEAQTQSEVASHLRVTLLSVHSASCASR